MSPADFVRARYGRRASAPVELGAGWWSRAHAFTLDGRESVIRFGRYVEDFRKDEIMGSRGSPRLPIPRVLEIGDAPDGYCCVSERAYGKHLDDLDAAGMRRVLPGLLSTLGELARVDPPGPGYGGFDATGAAPFPSWVEALLTVNAETPRTPGWRARLTPSAAQAFADGYAALRDLAGHIGDVPRRILHCDLLHRNVLVDGPRITALLDWGCAMYGDPLYDLAWLAYWWPWYPQWAGIDIRAALASDGRRLRAYQIHIGLAHIAWSAFTGNSEHLARNARQVTSLLHG